MTDDERWTERLAEMQAEGERRRAARKAERDEFARRRAYGLAQRHARKLNRLRAQEDR